MINAGAMNGYSDPTPNGVSSTNSNAPMHQPRAGSPDAAEDAAGDTDNDFDPLFDDESVHGGEAPASATTASAPAAPGAIQNGNYANTLQLHMPGSTQPPTPSGNQQAPQPPAPKKEVPILDPVTYADYSPDIFMTASIDGQVTLWDRRATPGRGVGRLEGNEKSPPWCVSVCMLCVRHMIALPDRNPPPGIFDRHVGPQMALRYMQAGEMERLMYGMSANTDQDLGKASPCSSKLFAILPVVGTLCVWLHSPIDSTSCGTFHSPRKLHVGEGIN